ncbi:DUF4058 family protein [Fimbriiglobus ruber]|uniref:DUF4058 domain-containing protein n=1 Tax=Fimbriiglobus ruber TaxID=1908690 RepID=A0A225D9B6_9BACT|nr:DUF4058 family protein [Fimbriiglobus ruber]OWK37563.1 hypothetical protein FRUB_06683 [Fimbriiglobus ruber]
MPIHDWTRVPSGLFHDFHQAWSIEIRNALNRGRLPKGYYALVEQRVDGPEPDVIAVETKTKGTASPGDTTAILEPPKTRLVARVPSEAGRYARRANRISVHHPLGNVVALIEIISPGNKDSRHAIRSFVEKAAAFVRAGVHLLVIDLFPPSDCDPQGIHKAIMDEFLEQPFAPPADKPLTLVSYQSASEIVAHIEPVAVGDVIPDMPLFLTPDAHIPTPLEATYWATWESCPEPIREMVQPAV